MNVTAIKKELGEIIITKDDKSFQTILLNKSNYIFHVETMLNSGLYIILNKGSSTNHLKEIKRSVKNSVLLSEQTKRIIIPSIANRARFYAVPKIHKTTFAFRPVVSNFDTTFYKLARFLSRSFAHLTCKKLYIVKNSYNFVDRHKNTSP